jgi:hypothetical protein
VRFWPVDRDGPARECRLRIGRTASGGLKIADIGYTGFMWMAVATPILVMLFALGMQHIEATVSGRYVRPAQRLDPRR